MDARNAYNVINLRTHKTHGMYSSLEEAMGCVLYDNLRSWQIWWKSTVLVAERDRG